MVTGIVRVIHRSQVLRSSHESPSPCPVRPFSRSIKRCFAAGSSSGIRPSGGSITSDSRSSPLARSIQPAPVPRVASITASCASCPRSFSASVLRSSGVLVELFQTPCKSGCPHGVLGSVVLSAGASSPPMPVAAREADRGASWLAAGVGASETTATRIQHTTRRR